MDLYEVLINELYFQGVTIMNQIRETFFIDLINPATTSINTEYFTAATFVYIAGEEKDQGDTDRHDLGKMLTYFCSKRKKQTETLKIRDFMIKIFITILSKIF
jgi:hypothetical protein